MFRLLETGSRRLAAVTAALGAACALIMSLSLLLGVFYRYVLNASLTWTDEVALLAFSWTIFLFASVLVRGFAHVRVTLVLGMLPATLRFMLERLNLLLVAAFGALMLWAGWNFAGFTAQQVSPALRYPLWLQGSAIPVSGALILFHATVLLLSPREHLAKEAQA
ncbi:TRAP transporter small permease [Stutzerimonas nitrititolerans]|uniref:TRAP transporter small permease n=1 Tax=Stutzerimonas nitrititolerans TaxID=2482751 RepID=UPI0028AC8A3B|nr:TRAP transporter small permease [Stutzerimonas nitrititolerans]